MKVPKLLSYATWTLFLLGSVLTAISVWFPWGTGFWAPRDWFWGSSEIELIVCFGTIFLFIIFPIQIALRKKLSSETSRNFWALFRIPRWCKFLARSLYVIPVCCLQVLVILFFSGLVYWHSARIVAFTAAKAGAYEFGEVIYSRTLRWGETSLVVAIDRPIDKPALKIFRNGDQSFLRSATDLKKLVARENELTRVVENVYGRESPQMGLRYSELGACYDFDLCEFKLAEEYQSKAAKVYLKNKRWDRVLHHLDMQLCIQFCQNNNHPGIRGILKEILSIEELRKTKLWTYTAYNLESIARKSGNSDLAEEFSKLYPASYKKERKNEEERAKSDSSFKRSTIAEVLAEDSLTLSKKEKSGKKSNDFSCYLFTGIYLLLIIYCFDLICLGILAFFNRVVIVAKRFQLLRKLKKGGSLESKFDCVDKLITLELYDARLVSADILSRHLLRLAENRNHCLNERI